MKVLGVIPARFNSTRFPGKPLANILGKPMLAWVYEAASKAKKLSELIVATDDERIAKVCKEHEMPFVMTSNKHSNHILRIHEVSNKIKADLYVCVNGDEPLIEAEAIDTIINKALSVENPYFISALRIMKDPAEVIDFANIKIVTDENDRCIYMSRSPVPYPRGTLLFEYKKCVGIECFSEEALDFYAKTPMGKIEKIEDIDQIRFLENNKTIYYVKIKSNSLAVDTPKDLEKVIEILKFKEKSCV